MCLKESKPGKEPLISTVLPKFPWQVVGTDLFELNKDNYVLVVDYFSRFHEVVKLTSTTSANVISALKSVFSRRGIPEIVRSDNGPQYASAEFSTFASSYGFQHITSSPRYPQSNRLAERCVQTVKNLIKKSSDPYQSLLSYRSTPLTWCDLSPAEVSMGRTLLPQTDKMLIPQWPFMNRSRQCSKREAKGKLWLQTPYQRVNSNPWRYWSLDRVRGSTYTRSSGFTRRQTKVICSGDSYRSSWANRSQLQVLPNTSETEIESPNVSPPEQPRRIMTRSKTGTAVSKPDRLVHQVWTELKGGHVCVHLLSCVISLTCDYVMVSCVCALLRGYSESI